VYFVRGRRFHRPAHWIGLIVAAPLLIIAAWAALAGWREPDLDERNALYGVAMFAPLGALALYSLARAVGWFLVELFD
jgi:hypothetical protein